jgi:hypothetical protein
MQIDSQALTTCEISSDGRQISLGFVDSTGRPSALKLPVEQVGALAMTLPALIERALRLRFSDNSLRYTYPLDSWSYEHAADAAKGIVTLRTTDGFSVCFSMGPQQLDELSEALATKPAPDAPRLAN